MAQGIPGSFVLPLASEVAAVQAEKIQIVNASGSDEAIKATVFLVLQTIATEITSVLLDKNNLGNSVTINLDRAIMARPSFGRVRAYLATRGFTSTSSVNSDTFTVVWAG